jgi:TfoX/Sxy family transcriptional regulator of competence genes
MTSDGDPTSRLRRALADHSGVSEKKMFGGICFMLRDHMLCGTGKPGFMFRVGEDQEAEALERPGATLMEFGRRRMRGFVWVDPSRCGERDLKKWIALAERYVAALPAKKQMPKAKTARR